MFVMKTSSMRHHKSYDYENNDKYFIYDPLDVLANWNYQNWDEIRFQRKCRSHLNHKQPSENFIYDPLDVLAIWNYRNWDNEIRFQSELNSFKKSDFFSRNYEISWHRSHKTNS